MDLTQFAASPDDMASLFKVSGEKRIDKTAKTSLAPVPLPRHQPGERFVRGPIPLTWLKAVSTIGGRAEAVALLLWYAAGYQRRNPVKLTPAILAELSVHPKTARRVLKKMADRGLVLVEFHRGRSPLVTITTPEADNSG